VKTGLVLVGGGLANCLLAHRLLGLRPDSELLLLERGEALGGRHTWSFHEGDLTPEQHAWIAPLVAHSWPRQEVRFPGRRRTIEAGYSSVTSERLHDVVVTALGPRLRVGAEVTELSPNGVKLADGSQVTAEAVVDGRGDPGGVHLDLGFQKFLGRTVELEEAHGLDGPVIMDATVPQEDGFRFLYTLPFGPRRVLIEDTRYADGPALAREELRREIEGYARAQGWAIRAVEDEEEGILPIVLGGDLDAFWDDGPVGVPRSGMRAALFHPTTGYSLPEAVRLADAIASAPALDSTVLFELTRRHSREAWGRGRFFRALNRMLYRAAEPAKRYRVLEHFYRLPAPLIARFYAGQVTWGDRLRVLSGRPPVPVGRALSALLAPTPRSPDARSGAEQRTRP
jgi:lycopene beta-cyclase